MMLGGVPMRVMSPPRMVAKDNGIRLRAGLRLAFFAACRSMGMKRASAATLFMMAESNPATAPIMPMWLISERPPSTTFSEINSMTPALESPRLTKIRATTSAPKATRS